MKILMPFKANIETPEGESSMSNKIVTGGIEKFSYQLYNSVPGIIPIALTKADSKHRRTRKIMEGAVAKYNPDMILSNWPWHYNMLRKFDLPIVTVYHEPLVRDMRFIDMASTFKKMKEDGAHLYFVSRGQFEYHKAAAKRIKNYDMTENDVAGFINSSYCENMPFSEEYEWDCSTVGRSDNEKNPFFIHKKLSSTNKISLVMTNDAVYKSARMNQYVADNQHWDSPQCTKRFLPHEEVLKNISKSKVFVSTWPDESWGITAMEALGCGVPLILITNEAGEHCSECIPADESHFIKLPRKSTTEKEFNDAVESLSTYSLEKRKEIYDKTNKKHTKKKWVKQFITMIDKRMEDAPHKSTLTEFMQ
jgi:glycosyltransferase involved in cell wall biosynthesis